jgi:hypothetical protein
VLSNGNDPRCSTKTKSVSNAKRKPTRAAVRASSPACAPGPFETARRRCAGPL